MIPIAIATRLSKATCNAHVQRLTGSKFAGNVTDMVDSDSSRDRVFAYVRLAVNGNGSSEMRGEINVDGVYIDLPILLLQARTVLLGLTLRDREISALTGNSSHM